MGTPAYYSARTVRIMIRGLVLTVGLLSGCGAAVPATPAPSAVVQAVTPAPTRARPAELLALLPVRNADPVGYQREAFGQPWADVDRNGCDTRNDILKRDLAGETFKPGTRDCVVLTGILTDPYTGQRLEFTRGAGSSAVQIDHVVSLADAWRAGANTWTPTQRLAYANDADNLLAVAGKVNQAKSDKTADEWGPDNPAGVCRYAATTVQVKTTYHLSVFGAERDALRRMLVGCPSQPRR